MHKILFIFICTVLHFNNCNSQVQKNNFHKRKMPFVYLESGAAWGYKKEFVHIGATVSLKNKWGLNFSQKIFSQNAALLPEDYKYGGLCFFGDCLPRDEFYISSFSIQRMFFSKNAKLRYTIDAGIGRLHSTVADFTKRPRVTGWIFFSGTNYNVNFTNEAKTGIIFSAFVESPFTNVAGLKIGTTAFIVPNSKYSHVGFQALLTLGYLREKIIKKPK
jgi:hypothetical protein